MTELIQTKMFLISLFRHAHPVADDACIEHENVKPFLLSQEFGGTMLYTLKRGKI